MALALLAGAGPAEAQSPLPGGAGKLTVFEIFDRTSCGHCKAAAAVVHDMVKEYAGRPVLFLEQHADRSLGNRFQRWQKKYNRKDSAALPFVMVDSGEELSAGPVTYASAFRGMLDRAMARPAPAALTGETHRVGNTFRVFLKLVYSGPNAITYQEHQPALQILVYDQAELYFAAYPLRAMVTTEVYQDLRPGATIPFILETPDLQKQLAGIYKGKVPWERLRVAALADYLPEGPSKAYALLGSCLAPLAVESGKK